MDQTKRMRINLWKGKFCQLYQQRKSIFTAGLRYEIKKCTANRGRSKEAIKALQELNTQEQTIERLTKNGRSINERCK